MNGQQGFIVGVSSRGRPIEGSCNYGFVVDHGKLVIDNLEIALVMGNSPADLAAVTGHRTEELLKTYAKPTGRVVIPSWS